MKRTLNGFNRVARYYDFLKRLVFGNAIYQSQVQFLNRLPRAGDLLVLGGGSGEFLPELWKVNPGCRIWYVEASSEMIRLAHRNVPAGCREIITFIHGTDRDIPGNQKFDGAITFYFLDLFADEKTVGICTTLASRLHPGGTWLVSDFVNQGKVWQRFLLAIMYRFFRAACSIEAQGLPRWVDHLRAAGMREKETRSWCRGFIKSAVYIK